MHLAAKVLHLRNVLGLTFPEIAETINLLGESSPRGRRFYPQIAYSMYRKWTGRIDRARRDLRIQLIDVSVGAAIDCSIATYQIDPKNIGS
jgi:hypothetical protein